MKKSLIALAAMAAVGTAFAQSSVIIDGTVDLGLVEPIGPTKLNLNAANGATQIRFRGSEDLGGGLRATFVAALRYSLESGALDGSVNARPLMQGESTVGLSGGFGAVRLGRALTALQAPVNSTDPWGTLQVATTAILTAGYSTDPYQPDGAGAGRTDAIHYDSPRFGGFGVAASWGPKSSAAVQGAGVVQRPADTYSLWASYAAGPLYVGGGYEQNRRKDNMWAVLATYNFGPVMIGAGYGKVDNDTLNDRRNWNVMATAPMGAFLFKLGYAVSRDTTASTDVSQKLGVGVDYNLSKRTKVYVSIGNEDKVASDKTGWDVGIRHTF